MERVEKLKQKWEETFQEKTVIQKESYEAIRSGEDIVAISPTGTGKTLAYVIPLLEKLQPNNELQLLVVVPSQELAQQVSYVMTEWAAIIGVSVQTITGGANVKRQLENLIKKPEIIIGTPGRLVELSSYKKLKLHQVKAIVLDEADHLLKPETLQLTRDLIKKCPSKRQFICFSATQNEQLLSLSTWFNVQARVIDVTKESLHSAENTTHAYIVTPVRKREDMLRRLAHVPDMRALVFVHSIAEADVLSKKLSYQHIQTAVLHSEMNKVDRQKALNDFKIGKYTFLLTTDVAARGLDIENLPAVIHYALPETKEMYIHRSGRTGRMGKQGLVLSLVNEREHRELKKLVPEEKSLIPLYAFQGELVDALPEKAMNTPIRKQNKRVEESTPSKKKVKNKKKHQKNKGKPKKSKTNRSI